MGEKLGKLQSERRNLKKYQKNLEFSRFSDFVRIFRFFSNLIFFFIFGMDFMKISTHGLVHYPWHNNQNFVETRNLLNSIKFIQGPICQEIFQQRHNFPSKHRDNPRNFENPFSIPNVTN